MEQDRPVLLGRYIAATGATVRKAGQEFRISKSTVHKDITERLFLINPALAGEVRIILDRNKAERHIRGGMATQRHFAEARQCPGRKKGGAKRAAP